MCTRCSPKTNSGNLIFAGVVLGALPVAGILLGRGHEVSRHVDLPALLMVACTSVAMGLQGIALRRVHGVPALTTGGTGNFTSLGERVGRVGLVRGRGDDELALGVIGGVVVVYVAVALLIQHAASDGET